MPVDRVLYAKYLTRQEAPPWPCPACGSGHYRLLQPSLHSEFTSGTQQAWSEEWFGAEHVEMRFVALMKCDNKKCSESASIAGRGEVLEFPDERMEKIEHQDIFYPTYVVPSPTLIELPTRCPQNVSEELAKAFVASWGDFSAAGNHIRAATELLLDALKIKKTKAQGARNRVPLNLHSRIESIKAKYPAVYELLLAIKWLGNAGSHPGALTRNSVFDAFDILESALNSLYSDHPKAIGKLVRAVNRRRGPHRKRE